MKSKALSIPTQQQKKTPQKINCSVESVGGIQNPRQEVVRLIPTPFSLAWQLRKPQNF